MLINKKSTCYLVEFAVPVYHRIKMREEQKDRQIPGFVRVK